jgi:hypothetical protein
MLDGLLITGRGLYVSGPPVDDTANYATASDDLCDVTIRHCTLVPGWSLHCDCGPRHPAEPSLELSETRARVRIAHSILGPVRVTADEVKSDPLALTITDSIWDALGADQCALTGSDNTFAHAALTIARCTVLGGVRTHELVLAENSIFTGAVRVARRQRGCVRFCHIPAGHCSRTPRRYHCQPDLVVQAVVARKLAPAEEAAAIERERFRVRPIFNSTRYGNPAYGQFAEACAPEIGQGADDESEIGAFHDLFQPQRAANLRARLEEFTPAGAEAGLIFTT